MQRHRDCGVYRLLIVLDLNILSSHRRPAVWLWGSPSTALGSWCPLDKLGNQSLCSGQESEHIISRTILSHVSDFVIVVIDNVDWTLHGHLALITALITGFPGGSVVKNLPVSAGDVGLIPGSEDPLEKGMATHSSILAWEIPRSEESGGLQSMGSQKSHIT